MWKQKRKNREREREQKLRGEEKSWRMKREGREGQGGGKKATRDNTATSDLLLFRLRLRLRLRLLFVLPPPDFTRVRAAVAVAPGEAFTLLGALVAATHEDRLWKLTSHRHLTWPFGSIFMERDCVHCTDRINISISAVRNRFGIQRENNDELRQCS